MTLSDSTKHNTQMSTNLKNIVRFQYPRHAFNGYRVCVCRKRRIYEKYFSAAKLGWAEALAQALEYRRELYKKLHISLKQKAGDESPA